MLPKVTKLKAVLEDQLQQHEIRYIPTPIVKQLEDDFRMLKEKDELFMHVFMGDFTNVSDMGEGATFNTKMKEIQNALTLLTPLVCAVRKQQFGA